MKFYLTHAENTSHSKLTKQIVKLKCTVCDLPSSVIFVFKSILI